MVRRANVGCFEDGPLRVVAQVVQVAHNGVEADVQVVTDVLEHEQARSEYGHCVGDMWPQPAFVVLALLLAGG